MFTRTFGIEIEAYNCESYQQVADALKAAGLKCEVQTYNHVTQSFWKVVCDNSIEGNGGFELVSPVLRGEDGLRQVRIAMERLTRIGVKVNKSCGLHVHFGADDLTAKELKAVLNRWIAYEDVIDLWMPQSRRENNNRYCRSAWSGYESKAQALFNLSLCRTIPEIVSNWARGDRYRKLNVQSYFRHRTIEFRHHSGTHEAEKAINWILFCGQFIEDALNNRRIVEGSLRERFESLFELQYAAAVSAVDQPTTLKGLKEEVARLLGSGTLKAAKAFAKQHGILGDYRTKGVWILILRKLNETMQPQQPIDNIAQFYRRRVAQLNSAELLAA